MAGPIRDNIYKRLTGRQMVAWRRWSYPVAAPLILGLVRGWWRSCRLVAVSGEERLDQVLGQYPSFLPCYWHQHNLFCSQFLLDQQRKRPFKVGFLVSPSVDGELAARILVRAGGHVIRGSSSRTGALAMKEYYNALTRDQVSPVLSPDGPRGPRFKFKAGAIMLAQMSGRPIVPMAYAASMAKLVHWDKSVLPMPFCRIALAIGEPQLMPRALSAQAVEQMQAKLEALMKATYLQARAALDGKRSS